MTTFAKKLIEIATSQLGKHESGGVNKGSDLAQYFAADNYKPNATDDGYPWCAAFLCYVIQKAMEACGVKETATFKRPKTPSAFGYEDWSLAQDNTTWTKRSPGMDIKAGDIVILKHSHIVLATGDADPATGVFPQISGNTSLAGSREGTHVLRHDAHFTSVRSRIRFRLP